MSRNLCCTTCDQCGGDEVWMVEPVRKIRESDCGVYFDEYQGMLVANAECRECEAKYLAWVTGGLGSWPHRNGAHGFGDLSYRSTFNDEPGDQDRAKWRIVRRRVPLDDTSPPSAITNPQ